MGDLIWVGNTLLPRDVVFWMVMAGMSVLVILGALIYAYGAKLVVWLFWQARKP